MRRGRRHGGRWQVLPCHLAGEVGFDPTNCQRIFPCRMRWTVAAPRAARAFPQPPRTSRAARRAGLPRLGGLRRAGAPRVPRAAGAAALRGRHQDPQLAPALRSRKTRVSGPVRRRLGDLVGRGPKSPWCGRTEPVAAMVGPRGEAPAGPSAVTPSAPKYERGGSPPRPCRRT